MFGKIFRPGCRLFVVGSILMLLTAAAHTAGHFAPLPDDAALKAVIEAMRGYSLDMGFGMRPSVAGIQESLSLTMSIFLVVLGVQNLATIFWAGDSIKLVRGLTVINLVCAAALAALYWHYRIPPPLICFILICICFLFALALPSNRRI